jgi:nucleotide-binding universal stress UspA family protein
VAEDVDALVVGSHGRDGVTRLLPGSVAETVVRRSPVPVTVVG